MAAAGAGDAGELDVLLPFSGGAGLRSDFGTRSFMGLEPGAGGA